MKQDEASLSASNRPPPLNDLRGGGAGFWQKLSKAIDRATAIPLALDLLIEIVPGEGWKARADRDNQCDRSADDPTSRRSSHPQVQ